MRKDSPYKPGFSAYRNVLVALSRTTKDDATRWELLRRPFHALVGHYRKFYPDELLLRIGLNYCEATKDSELAKTLVTRSVQKHAPRNGVTKIQGLNSLSVERSRFLDDYDWKDAQGSEAEIQDKSLGSMKATESMDPMEARVVAGPTPVVESLGSVQNDRDESAIRVAALHGDPNDSTGALSAFSDPDEGDPAEPVASASKDSIGAQGEETQLFQIDAPPFSYKVFQKALKVCLNADDLQGSRDILHSYSRMRHLYPKGIESDIWGFVVRGFAFLGHSPDSVKSLLDDMKHKNLNINEETYGAVLHSFATGKRHKEATEFFNTLRMAPDDSSMAPGVNCYNAMILSHISRKDWNEVLNTYQEMSASGLSPNSATTQGVMIASFRLGGAEQARQTLEEALEAKVGIGGENCLLAIKLLMPDILEGNSSASVQSIQGYLRRIGDADELLRSACLNLLRSIRRADTEQRRLPTKRAPEEVLCRRREEAWHATLRDILDLDWMRRKQTAQQSVELNSGS